MGHDLVATRTGCMARAGARPRRHSRGGCRRSRSIHHPQTQGVTPSRVGLEGHSLVCLWGARSHRKTVLAVEGHVVLYGRIRRPGSGSRAWVEGHLAFGRCIQPLSLKVGQVGKSWGAHWGARGLERVQACSQATWGAGQKAVWWVGVLWGGQRQSTDQTGSMDQRHGHGRHGRGVQIIPMFLLDPYCKSGERKRAKYMGEKRKEEKT